MDNETYEPEHSNAINMFSATLYENKKGTRLNYDHLSGAGAKTNTKP